MRVPKPKNPLAAARTLASNPLPTNRTSSVTTCAMTAVSAAETAEASRRRESGVEITDQP